MKRKILALLLVTAMASPFAQAQVKVSTKGGLKVSSGDYSFQIGGRIQYDYNRSELNGEVDEDDFDLRRGRLFVKGNIAKNWAFKSQFNVDGEGFEDLYLRYTGWGSVATVTIGNQKVPFGLEALLSSNDMPVLERTGITELFSLGRAEGVQLSGKKRNQTYAISVFTDDDTDSEVGFGARYTVAPVKKDDRVVHLGVAYRDIDENQAFGLEAAAVSGPFHVQAEYFDGEQGSNDDLDGYYIQAGYIFTGETRPYKSGVFKRVAPKSKAGAWEGVIRYEDGDGDFGDIELGTTEASAYTIGLNYYAHKNIRLGINYSDGDDDLSDDDGNEFRIRFQLTF